MNRKWHSFVRTVAAVIIIPAYVPPGCEAAYIEYVTRYELASPTTTVVDRCNIFTRSRCR